MCGESLESTTKAEEPKSSRIRQRTMSMPNEELTRAASKFREEAPALGASAAASDSGADPANRPDAYPTIDPFVTSSNTAEIDDPLGAYIQEITAGEQANRNKQPSSSGNLGAGSGNVPSSSGFLKPAIPVSAPTPPVKNPSNSGIVANPTTPQVEVDIADLLGSSDPAAVPPPPIMPAITEESKPKVIVETGNRRLGKSGSFSFTRPKPDGAETPKRGGTEGGELSEDSTAKIPAPKESSAEKEVSAAAVAGSKPVRAGEVSGRLVGWWVSYQNPDGDATELREGKFFVSRTALKPNDCIIDDESVSTPHAIVIVTGEGVLRIQDLMSERGVFVRTRGADAYQRSAEIVEVRHGDWIRFGDVEYLLCLIDQVGKK